MKPENATNKNVKWTSSDETVATVDENGKVTALKEGTTEVIATTEDGNLSAKCIVTVIKEPVVAEKERAILTIYMSNGAVKKYDLSLSELNAFLDWYDARSKGTAPAYYVFENKPLGNVTSSKSYIPYDKIENFDVDTYQAN